MTNSQERKEKLKRHMVEVPQEAIKLARKHRGEREGQTGEKMNLGTAIFELMVKGYGK